MYKQDLTLLSEHIKQYHQYMKLQLLENALSIVVNQMPRVGNVMFDLCLNQRTEFAVFISLHVAKIIIMFIEPFMPQLSLHGKRFLNISKEYYNMEKAEMLKLPCGSTIPEDGSKKYFMWEQKR